MCLIRFEDSCILNLIQAMIIAGILLIGIGVFFYKFGNNPNETNEIQRVDISFQRSEPTYDEDSGYSDGEGDSTDYDENDRPFPIGTKFFSGEFLGLGVQLEVIDYNDEEGEIICLLRAEVPEGSSYPHVTHKMDTDYPLGTATIKYYMNGNEKTVLVDMSCEDLEDCDYNVVIKAHESTTKDIAE